MDACKCSTDKKMLTKTGNSGSQDYFGGKALEVRTEYRCPVCGVRWEHLSESGVGGHGSFWTCLKDS